VRRDWGDVTTGVSRRVYGGDSDLFDDAVIKVPLEGCVDASCRIQRAVNWARDVVAFKGFDQLSDVRAMDKVIESGAASAHEKAMLLWKGLETSGVEARLALITRPATRRFDARFPSTLWFNHAIVMVPSQAGLPGPVWLDPSCEHCRVGQLPAWSHGSKALVLTSAWGNGQREYQAEFIDTTAAPLPPSGVQTTYLAQITDEGAIEILSSVEESGSFATAALLRERTWRARQSLTAAERFVSKRSASGRLLEHSHTRCARTVGICKRQLRFTLPAPTAGPKGELVMPLHMLQSGWDDAFDTHDRALAVVLGMPWVTSETVQVTVPKGYTLAHGPTPVSVSSGAFSTSLTWDETPENVTVRRTITVQPGSWSAAGYGEHRAAVRAFARLRRGALVFRPAQPEAAP